MAVCRNQRIHQHKVFAGIAARGKTSMGWLYGFKLHLVANDCGELLACQLTPGNIDDRQPVPTLAKRLFGKLFGDKGYINQQLVAQLLNACTFPPPQSAQLCRQSVGQPDCLLPATQETVTAPASSGSVAGCLTRIHVTNYNPSNVNIVNNGHTVEVVYAPGSFFTLDGEQYDLKQFR